MKGFRRFLLWYALLTKRLARKPAFLILLLCVPLLAGAMAVVAKQDSSIVSVALVCDTDDGAARRAAERLLRADSLVRCTQYASDPTPAPPSPETAPTRPGSSATAPPTSLNASSPAAGPAAPSSSWSGRTPCSSA